MKPTERLKELMAEITEHKRTEPLHKGDPVIATDLALKGAMWVYPASRESFVYAEVIDPKPLPDEPHLVMIRASIVSDIIVHRNTLVKRSTEFNRL